MLTLRHSQASVHMIHARSLCKLCSQKHNLTRPQPVWFDKTNKSGHEYGMKEQTNHWWQRLKHTTSFIRTLYGNVQETPWRNKAILRTFA